MNEQDFDPMKEVVIDALMGVGLPGRVIAAECEKTGLAKNGMWKRKALEGCSLEALQELYVSIKRAKQSIIDHTTQRADRVTRIIVPGGA